jgi:hypothetical protein
MITYTQYMLNSVITCKLMGGLGNQLFQICATISYGIDTNRTIIFPYSDFLTVGNKRPTYWNDFLKSLLTFTTSNKTNYYNNQCLSSFPSIQEIEFAYTPLPHKPECMELMLSGYFQSYKYFESNKAEILSILDIETQQDNIRHEYLGLDSESINISMHFRIGDYQDLQHAHPLLPINYYDNAIRKITEQIQGSPIRILYFCEDNDLHLVESKIQLLEETYDCYITFVHVDSSIPDWKQMLIMSCCHHNIIANSSFSWWGAYLNQYPSKMVCYPYKWFGPALVRNSTVDLTPNDWIRIQY